MSTTTYFPYEQELKHFINSVDISEHEPANNNNWGGYNPKIHTKEMYIENGKYHKNKIVSIETRKKISDFRKGLPSPMTGKIHSPETRQKMREIKRKRDPLTGRYLPKKL